MAQVDALGQVQPRVGTRKLRAALATAGVRVGRDRLFTALRATGRLMPWKRRATQTTYARHHFAVAPNHLKTMTVTGPRQVVVSEIIYIRLDHGAFA